MLRVQALIFSEGKNVYFFKNIFLTWQRKTFQCRIFERKETLKVFHVPSCFSASGY